MLDLGLKALPRSSSSQLTRSIVTATPKLHTISRDDLNIYGQSQPATPDELRFANRYFKATKPQLMVTTPNFVHFPRSTVPEVAFLGRSNAGKSSLLNAVAHESGNKKTKDRDAELAFVSAKPGRTRTMNAFGIGRVFKTRKEPGSGRIVNEWSGEKGLVIVDMPGYGKGSRAEWGEEIVKYLKKREQLKRTFLLIDAEHGIKSGDERTLEILAECDVPYQLILSKVDKLLPKKKGNQISKQFPPDEAQEILEDAAQKLIEKAASVADDTARHGVILACAADGGQGMTRLGVDGIRWAVLDACERLEKAT